MVFITAAVSAPIYYRRIALPVDTDYGSHVRFTQQLIDGEKLEPGLLSHPVLQLILAGMHLLTGRKLGLYASLILLQVAIQVLTALILYFWFDSGQKKERDWLHAFWAGSLTLVAPVMLLAIADIKFYYGYIGLANYHNPTLHLLKPVALLSFRYAVIAFERQSSWKSVLLAALWMVLSAGIKPNFALAILPGLGLAVAICLIQHRHPDWKMLLGGFAIPGGAMLAFQWLFTYIYGDPGEGIILAPFQVEGAYSDWLLPKFFLSVLFPLSVLLVARKQAFIDASLLVGWAGFLVGAAQFYLLAEGGRRMMDANFRWSGQIMLFLFFAASVRWLIGKDAKLFLNAAWQRWVCYSMYLAHLSGGLIYYIYCMISTHYR